MPEEQNSAEGAGGSEAGWRRFRRIGTVHARQLDADSVWETSAGDRMTGRLGDWVVEDDSGGVRTVDNMKFRESHLHLHDSLWERCSHLEARPARASETATSVEGVSTAAEGDWVVRDSPGNAWVVPGGHFRKAYRPEP